MCGYTPEIDCDCAPAAHGLALKTTVKGIPSNGWGFRGAPGYLPGLDGGYDAQTPGQYHMTGSGDQRPGVGGTGRSGLRVG